MLLDPDAISSSTIVQPPEVNAQQPWLGLLPYREEHREFFFGRDREVEDILGRIRDNNLTILYGQSGLGKSSLLAAGVVPRLREAGYAPAIISRCFNEGPDRLTLLGQTKAALTVVQPSPAAVAPITGGGSTTLWELLHHRSTPDSPIPVLIFDQFEEIFTLGAQLQYETEVADWLEQMADLLQNRPPLHLAVRFAHDRVLAEQYHFGDAPVRIVFTLREDYLVVHHIKIDG